MGVKNLSQIIGDGISSTIKLSDMSGQRIGFDAFNQLFQFLSSIRDQTGQNLVDNKGNITSHLIGILSRGCNLIQENIKPVYVFDGKSHELKSQEQGKRREAKNLAKIEYEKAIAAGDNERAKMFAKRINELKPEMVEDAKQLLLAMGIPVVQGPGEGEAQAAQMTIEGIIDATASQDYDTLAFGAPTLIRNLNIVGKRNLPGGGTKTIYPEQYSLEKVLRKLGLDQNQFVDLGIIMGTDFNNEGFKGVGPKTAYKFIKKYGSFEKAYQNEDKLNVIDIPYETIRDIFLKPNVIKNAKVDYSLEFDKDAINQFLSDKNFSLGRYENLLNKTAKALNKNAKQTSLSDWF